MIAMRPAGPLIIMCSDLFRYGNLYSFNFTRLGRTYTLMVNVLRVFLL